MKRKRKMSGEILWGVISRLPKDSDGAVRYEDLESVLSSSQTHEDCRERIGLISDSSFTSEEKERILRVL